MDIFELFKLMIDRLWIKLSLKLLQHNTRPVHDTNDQTISCIFFLLVFQQVSKTDSLSWKTIYSKHNDIFSRVKCPVLHFKTILTYIYRLFWYFLQLYLFHYNNIQRIFGYFKICFQQLHYKSIGGCGDNIRCGWFLYVTLKKTLKIYLKDIWWYFRTLFNALTPSLWYCMFFMKNVSMFSVIDHSK